MVFRYEAMWESHKEFKPMVEEVWTSEQSTTMHNLGKKLKSLSNSMLEWGRSTFGHVQREIRVLCGVLAELWARTDRVGPTHQELKVVEQLVELQHWEETMWRQRSRHQWLADGDRNTCFFHLRASRRKKKNKIRRLKHPNGSFTED
jgi:hypothetical protein